MPITLAPFIGFALGVLLAWLSRTAPNADKALRDPPTVAVALYATVVFAPAVAYFALFATDWSFAYLIDARRIPSAISLALVLFAAFAVVGGYRAGQHALERRAPNELAWFAAAPLSITIIAIAALFDRFSIDASYEQFTSDFGRTSLFASTLGFAVLWMNGIIAAGAIATVRALSPKSPPGQTPPTIVSAAPPPSPSAHDDGPRRLLGQTRPSR